MSSAQSMPADMIDGQRDVFIERFLGFASGTFNIFSVYIGDRLGLYRALAEAGPSTSSELASLTHTHERYIRWPSCSLALSAHCRSSGRVSQ
jgi:hypothetical protein